MSDPPVPDATSPAPEERPFSEPWQAQAFALTLQLHEAGHFSWQEWSRYLADAIGADATHADASNDSYYRHWLAALEKLLADKQLVNAEERRIRGQAWDRAARRTPHGQPVVLGDTDPDT